MKNKLKIVAGIITNEKNEILIARRKKNKKDFLKWEFPGGKVEKNEENRTALSRELNGGVFN